MRFFPHPHERFRFAIFVALFALSLGVHSAVTSARSVSATSLSPVPVGMQRSAETVRETRKSLPPKGTQDFSPAIEERTKLLSHSVTVEFTAEKDGAEESVATWSVAMKDHPLWIVFDTSVLANPTAVISEKRIEQFIGTKPFSIPSPRICDLLSSWKDKYEVARAQTSCIAQSGYTYDQDRFVQSLRAALEQGKTTLRFPLTFVSATIRSTGDTGEAEELTLLSTGRSTFKGSGLGRKDNVRMALNEKVHNVLVPEGSVFSFNQVLGPAVTTGNGWKMALTIFEGENLRPAPGGGICQASTTVFRAALRAGLPIVKQKNHSLYVTYYEAYGVGQDATVFPGKQDLQFVNNTGGPLLIQSYNDGDEAYVHFYGKDDGRTVTLTGPYFTKTAPAGEKIGGNAILWKRMVDMPGQEVISDSFLSRYKAISKSLSTKWPALVEQTRGIPLHAAAEEVAATE